jgi:hypothetical protein
VRTSTLITTIRKVSPHADKFDLEKLTRMLDAQRDDAFVSLADFLAVGTKWVALVRDGGGGAEGDTPKSTSNWSQSHSNSSLGLLSSTELNESIFASLDDRGASAAAGAADSVELAMELMEVK